MTLTDARLYAVLGLALAVAFAGCVGQEEATTTEDESTTGQPANVSALADMTAEGEDHDHANPAQHDVAYNSELLDHLRLVEQNESGTHALALVDETETLYAASTLRGNHGFYAIDVSEPSNLSVVGEWHDDAAVGGDRSIAASQDGEWVVLGTEGDTEEEEAGVRLFDVSDPTDPTQADFMPLDGGAHTVDILEIDGSTYVFALNYGVQILEVTEGPLGPQLVKVGQYTYSGPEMTNAPQYENPANYPAWGLRSVYAHDMKPIDDPEAGPLLYVAYAYQGMQVLDISQPSSPELVSRWTPGGEQSPWYTHTVDAEWIGDKRVIVVGSEVFEARHNDTPSPVWVLDGTDLQNPELTATWTNPAGAGSQNLLFSAHFLRLDQGYAHLSHYHAGTWVLNLTTAEERKAPSVAGAYLPSQDTGYRPGTECCLGFNLAGVPITMDAVGDGDVTYAADIQTGVYAIHTEGIPS